MPSVPGGKHFFLRLRCFTDFSPICIPSIAIGVAGVHHIIGRRNCKDSRKNIEEPEPIHTFLHWKEYGYSVKKGEKAIAQLEIWKYTEKKKTDGEDTEEETAEHAFKKKAFFFCFAQVEPIRRKADESEKV